MSRLRGLAILLVLGIGPASAGGDEEAAAAGTIVADMKVHVASDGHVLEVIPDASVPAELHSLLRKRVSTWQFSVPMWKGQPVSMWTGYTLWMQPVPTTTGGFALRITPGGTRMMDDDSPRKAPVYPEQLMRRGIGGQFVYEILLAADGTLRNVERRWPPGELDRDHRRLDESSRKAIAGSEWTPVVVDGAPVTCRLFYPIVFTPHGEKPGKVELDQAKAATTDLCPTSHLETPVLGSLL